MKKCDIKNIFEKEIERHTEEIIEHKRLLKIRQSKTQKKKTVKHFHKLHQTILLVKQLGFKHCKCCGGLK